MPGQIWPGMKYCSIWVEIHGFTPNLSSISGLVELGIIPMNLLPFWAVFHAQSNSTSRIWPGMKYCSIWVEIHGFTSNLSSISGLVELGIIPMNFLPFWAVFHARSNSTGHEILLKLGWNSLYACLVKLGIISMDLLPIRPGMKYCSKWVEIHWNYTILQWKINTKLHNTSEVDLASKSTGFIKLLHFWVFLYFLSSKSTFITCPQTGWLQF